MIESGIQTGGVMKTSAAQLYTSACGSVAGWLANLRAGIGTLRPDVADRTEMQARNISILEERAALIESLAIARRERDAFARETQTWYKLAMDYRNERNALKKELAERKLSPLGQLRKKISGLNEPHD